MNMFLVVVSTAYGCTGVENIGCMQKWQQKEEERKGREKKKVSDNT